MNGRAMDLTLLDGLFENAPVGFTFVDTELRYQRVNASVAALNGGSTEERIGRTIDEVHGEPCGPQFSAVCREVIRTGQPRHVRIEGRLWHGTGPHQVWQMNYYPVFDDDGAVIGVGDVFVDVTETERTQHELALLAVARRRTVIRYRSLIEASTAAVWTADPDGVPIPDPDAAPGTERWFLADAHPADLAAAEHHWREAVAAGSVYSHVARLRVATGGYRHFRIRAVPVVVEDRLTEWIGTQTEVEFEVRARTRLELLARATEAVNRELTPEQELQALVEVLVPDFADAATIHLIDPVMPGGPLTGRELISRVGIDVPGAAAERRSFSYARDHPFTELLRTDRPMLVSHPLPSGSRPHGSLLAEREGEPDRHTSLLTPIRSNGTMIAVLSFLARGDRPPFVDEDLIFARELAARASAAVEHAHRFQETRLAALTLQRAMLTELPGRTDMEIAARYQPALADLQVGGDWYDAFTLPCGDLGLVVGDVVGHDLHAATVMGQLRSMFRGVAMDDAMEPPAAVERLNELAIALNITPFTTFLYARLRPDGRGGATVTWTNAGHPAPLLVRPGHDSRSLTDGAGIVLGVPTRVPRTSGRVTLDPGSTLVLYTDGLIERRVADLDEMTARLEELAAGLCEAPLPEFCDELLARSQPETGDDIVILAVRLPPAEHRPTGGR